ncbi:CHAT domain-containing protein [Dactylosporangium sp. AC04546]|uniref:CHAT domain-containing tetratricopeptide repeat protein n=1 Tax=Dactylosporangium sp. AC04546 TaxID=2862460 RepID=UPI001EDE9C50|nr:CHAT domain-containing protein [Dactylosporangium sp. AC04546]WVK88662.1 CHAT domain-containing protein [Dactylosporangium sp. AC04546]
MAQWLDGLRRVVRGVRSAATAEMVARWNNEAIDILQDPYRVADPAQLDRATQLLRRVVDRTAPESPDRPMYLCNLSGALLERFERTDDRAALDEAISSGRAAADLSAVDEPRLAAMFSSLGSALRTRYELDGSDPADLDDAERYGRVAVVASADDGHPDRPGSLTNLALTLWTRHERGGRAADLDETIRLMRAVADLLPAGHPDRPAALSNLCGALRTRFERAGNPDDLDAAVRAGRAMLSETDPGHPELDRMQLNLGSTLIMRFDHAGDRADLDEAVRLHRDAVAAIDGRYAVQQLTIAASNLAKTLRTAFHRTQDPADLDEAVDAARTAVRATPAGHFDTALHLSDLVTTLLTRFEAVGAPADLDEAVRTARTAVELTAGGHPDESNCLAIASLALRLRFEHAGNLDDVNEAVDLIRAAMAVAPAGHPGSASDLFSLAEALHSRYGRTGDTADADEIITVGRRGALSTTARPAVRSWCALTWLNAAALRSRWDEARDALEVMTALLPQVATRGLTLEDRRSRISGVQGLGPLAAWSLLHSSPEETAAADAWVGLEATRGILLSQALETRGDLVALRQAHPDLAEEVTRLRQILNREPDDADRTTAPARRAGTLRAQASADWPGLLDRVRELPGFDRFGLPPTIEQLHAAAGDGTVVAPIVTEHGCGALLLSAHDAGYLALPWLTRDDVTDQANRLAVLNTDATAEPGLVTGVLDWLWETTVGPVLDHLGHRPVQAGGPWPRIWWMPTGLTSVLPLHAAGRHDGSGDAALDRVVSSYIPTVRALHHVRRHDRPAAATAAAVVGVNRLDEHVTLASAEDEARAVQRLLPAGTPALLGPQATNEAVARLLPATGWVHFACHAQVDPADPSGSFLALHDRPLTVRQLTGTELSGAHLAVLSSCTTAAVPLTSLDEPIHLASAFQLAGYPHTIATLWPISDAWAPTLARNLYRRLTVDTSPATALHETVRALRADRAVARRPELWASHVHFGP